MFEARLEQGSLLKKIVEAMKDLVTDANLECNEDGIKLQAMDSSHVSLISLSLAKEGFAEYRCDRSLFLGLNLVSVRHGAAQPAPAATAAFRAVAPPCAARCLCDCGGGGSPASLAFALDAYAG